MAPHPYIPDFFSSFAKLSVNTLIDAYEIVDEELLNRIEILLSKTATKSEKIRNNKIIWNIAYSMMVGEFEL